ncbi:hypothetical protein RhiTH_007476 [Rhizoctonia solani]
MKRRMIRLHQTPFGVRSGSAYSARELPFRLGSSLDSVTSTQDNNEKDYTAASRHRRLYMLEQGVHGGMLPNRMYIARARIRGYASLSITWYTRLQRPLDLLRLVEKDGRELESYIETSLSTAGLKPLEMAIQARDNPETQIISPRRSQSTSLEQVLVHVHTD